MGDIKSDLENIKEELRVQETVSAILEKRSEALETCYEYQSEKLDEIKKQVDEIADIVRTIENKFSSHAGAAEMKSKIFNRFSAIGTFVLMLLSNDFIMHKLS